MREGRVGRERGKGENKGETEGRGSEMSVLISQVE